MCAKELTFLERKVDIRTSLKTHQFILAKVFEIPKDFLQKVLWLGFGADAPTFTSTHKKHGIAVLFISLRKNERIFI